MKKQNNSYYINRIKIRERGNPGVTGFPLSLFYRILRILLYSSRKFRTQKKDVRIITDILS
ncbi:hypothetical protein BACSTE_02145 [Bacteroides stercoris ATCC 43183]|uniref:Uncharacterized protein n=1 Tax=Bacteroides stercoris ATCC 43183 TaxID=449673 RepID=B0NRN4_BACSE|nr:hypothetical protein BACSTE_02145 [Bacteroides stercoris ATCC 43183]